jgi:hypothetical protein
MRGQQTKAGRVGAIQVSTTSARQTCKRKIEEHDSDTDQTSPDPAPVRKRICREKTGTDWQTVLDIIEYGEERSRTQMDD